MQNWPVCIVVINGSIPVFQHIMDLIKLEPNSDSEMCLTSSESGSQLIHVKQEEAPPFMSFEIKTEHEVSSVSMCSFFKHLILIYLVLEGAENRMWWCS